MAASVAAIHLPVTNATRGVGFTSSGSSEPRSRSPAVESVAICIPPTKPALGEGEGEKQQPVAVGAKGADKDEPAEEPAGEDRDAGSEAAE